MSGDEGCKFLGGFNAALAIPALIVRAMLVIGLEGDEVSVLQHGVNYAYKFVRDA